MRIALTAQLLYPAELQWMAPDTDVFSKHFVKNYEELKILAKIL